jgi:Fibronectin type III domain
MKKNYIHKHALMLIIITFALGIFPGQLSATTFDNDTILGFTWDPSVGEITYYEVHVSENSAPFYLEGTTTAASYEISGQSSSEYIIKVRAVNASGPGAYSNVSDPVICDTVSPTKPAIDNNYLRSDLYTIEIELLQQSTDDYLKTYQVSGGQYSVWTDTSETECFSFTIDPYQEQILSVRAVDLAGNQGPIDIVTIIVDSDSDGQPDIDEIICGTDYNDPDACFIMQAVQEESNGNTTLIWNASQGRAYQLFYSDDLNTWETADIIVADTDTDIIWEGDTALPSEVDHRFYRVCIANEFDSDLDGMSDFDEVLFGSDLGDPGSIFILTVSEDQSTGHQILTWTAAPKRVYEVYYLDEYNSQWTLADTVTAAAGTQIIWEDDGAFTTPAPSQVTQRVYKLRPIYDPDYSMS